MARTVDVDDVFSDFLRPLFRMKNEADREQFVYELVDFGRRHKVSPTRADCLIIHLLKHGSELKVLVAAVELASERYKRQTFDAVLMAGDMICAKKMEHLLNRSITEPEARVLLQNFMKHPTANICYKMPAPIIARYINTANHVLLERKVLLHFNAHQSLAQSVNTALRATR